VPARATGRTAAGRTISRAAWALAAGGIAVHALHVGTGLFGQGVDTLIDDWLYIALIGLAAALALAAGLRRHEQRAACACLGAAIGLWFTGELVWQVGGQPASPAPSDWLMLAYYPLAFAGLVLLVRPHLRIAQRLLWLDGGIAVAASAAAGAAVLLPWTVNETGGSAGLVAVNLAFPVADVLLLGFLAAALAILGAARAPRHLLLMAAAVAVAGIADGVYLIQAARGTYLDGTLLDTLWPLAMLIQAACLWVMPDGPVEAVAGPRRPLLVPGIFGTGAVLVLVWGNVATVPWPAAAFAVLALLLIIARLMATMRENRRMLAGAREQATIDPLTGLGNRRRLFADLERLLADADAAPHMLGLFDLDGFKGYNDTFGHPAGDVLLVRFASRLATAVGAGGRAYRLGGDEFCAIVPTAPGEEAARLDAMLSALTERGEGFAVECSAGVVLIPLEAHDPSSAIRFADRRMYANKHTRRATGGEAYDALLAVLRERDPATGEHANDVLALAVRVGARLGMGAESLEELARAAALKDIGNIAIPDDILRKPGVLEPAEWAFMRQHTIIGERLLGASPALAAVGRIVRATHERFDGSGYPDGLRGAGIPLASRVVAACDAWAAMRSDRPYRPALDADAARAELVANRGTQFDPAAVDALIAELDVAGERSAATAAAV
jgi:two-component system, cell cycle response regulator